MSYIYIYFCFLANSCFVLRAAPCSARTRPTAVSPDADWRNWSSAPGAAWWVRGDIWRPADAMSSPYCSLNTIWISCLESSCDCLVLFQAVSHYFYYSHIHLFIFMSSSFYSHHRVPYVRARSPRHRGERAQWGHALRTQFDCPDSHATVII